MIDTLPEDIRAEFEADKANCKSAYQLAKCYGKYMGIELTEEQIEKARRKFGTTIMSMDECINYALAK